MQFNPLYPGRICALLIPCFLLFDSPSVIADEADAFNFFVGTSQTRDNNVFRLSPDTNTQALLGTTERGDTIRNTFYGGSFNKLIGRQKVELNINLNSSRYERFSFLNFEGSNVAANFDWRLTNILGGQIGKTNTRSLASFSDLRTPVKSVNTTDSEFANMDLWFMPSWHFEAGVRQTKARNEADVTRIGNSIVEAKTVGVRYKPSSGNFILLRTIRSDGQLPNREFVAGSSIDNSYRQTEAGFDTSWLVTGHSRLSGTLAHTWREHKNIPERNFSGLTGNAIWEWSATGKTTVISKVSRNLDAISGDVLASYIVTETASLAANWMPTAKLTLGMRYEKNRRNYSGDPTSFLTAAEKRHDKITSTSLNMNYQAVRNVTLGMNFVKSERDSNVAGLPFSDKTVGVNAQFTF